MASNDFILANSLNPSDNVNVIDQKDKSIYKIGTILSFADCSKQGEIYYNVQLADSEFLPEHDAESQSYKNFQISFEQMNKNRGISTPTTTPTKNLGKVDLDNLIWTSRSRVKQGTSIKSTPSTKSSISTPKRPKR